MLVFAACVPLSTSLSVMSRGTFMISVWNYWNLCPCKRLVNGTMCIFSVRKWSSSMFPFTIMSLIKNTWCWCDWFACSKTLYHSDTVTWRSCCPSGAWYMHCTLVLRGSKLTIVSVALRHARRWNWSWWRLSCLIFTSLTYSPQHLSKSSSCPPTWPLKVPWVLYNTSTYHLMSVKSLAHRMRGKWMLPCTYFNIFSTYPSNLCHVFLLLLSVKWWLTGCLNLLYFTLSVAVPPLFERP